MAKKKSNLYDNIRKKRARIKSGSGEKMKKAGDKGRPTAATFKNAAKTAKKKPVRGSRTKTNRKKRGK
jgi:hypothetical protein